MIRINLHDYQYEMRQIEIQKRVVKCFAFIITAIGLILIHWLVEKDRLVSIKNEINKVKSQVAALQSQVKMVNTMEMKQNRMETIMGEIQSSPETRKSLLLRWYSTNPLQLVHLLHQYQQYLSLIHI